VGYRNLTEGCQTILGTSHIVHLNVIDILVGLSTLVDYLHLHALLKDELKLRLLIGGKCMSILDQLDKLFISEIDTSWLVGPIGRVLVHTHILLELFGVSMILILLIIVLGLVVFNQVVFIPGG
jgi:hypothetical protein